MHEDETLSPLPSAKETGEQNSVRSKHCWEIVRQIPGIQFNCEECYAYFVQQDCWSLWALRKPGFKPCCQKKGDCSACSVLIERMRPESGEQIAVQQQRPTRPPVSSNAKHICSYLELYSGGNLVEGEARAAEISRALQIRHADFRCRLRGVHLDIGYITDICVSRHVEECVFLDEVRPEIRIRPLPVLQSYMYPVEHKNNKEKESHDPVSAPPSA